MPLTAAAKGLPQVSSLRNTSESRREASKKWRMAGSSPCSRLSVSYSSPRPCSIVRSAPPEKLSLPEVMTQPFTAGSATTASTMVSISSITACVMTFIERPGQSQVANATPSASVSKRKFWRFIADPRVPVGLECGALTVWRVLHFRRSAGFK